MCTTSNSSNITHIQQSGNEHHLHSKVRKLTWSYKAGVANSKILGCTRYTFGAVATGTILTRAEYICQIGGQSLGDFYFAYRHGSGSLVPATVSIENHIDLVHCANSYWLDMSSNAGHDMRSVFARSLPGKACIPVGTWEITLTLIRSSRLKTTSCWNS